MAGSSQFPVIPGIEILEVAGRGGFATVYRGYQPAFNRHVAVKVLQRSELDEDARRRFDRECRVMGALSNHPYIVPLYVAGYTESERPYMVMPFVSDGTLDDRIRRGGAMPWAEVVQTGVRLSGALETAHRAGVLHRDIKPANVLRSEYGDLLGDFGIARIAGGHETQSGVVTASIAHAPPEVLEGEVPSVRADVYSLGSTMFEALTGRAAFSQTSESVGFASMIRRILLDPPPTLTTDQAPDAVAEVVERALSKDAADRHASAEEFGEALQAAQRSLSLGPTDMFIIGAETSAATTATVDGSEPIERIDDRTVVVAGQQPPDRSVPDHDDPVSTPADIATATRHQASAPPVAPEPPTPDESRTTGRIWMLAGAIGLAVVLVIAGLVAVARRGEEAATSATAASSDTPATSPATNTSTSAAPASTISPSTAPPSIVAPNQGPLVLPPGGPVRIGLLNPGIQSDLLEGLVRGFEADNPMVSVEIIEESGYRASLNALVSGNVEPDVALLADRAVQSVLDQLNYVPVREFIDRDDFDDTVLLANAADMYSTREGLAAMPFNVAVPMMYANQNLLDRAEIELAPGASLTTEGLLDRCALLESVVATCIEFGSDAFLFTELVTNSGGRVFDTGGFEGSASAVGFDTPMGRTIFDFLATTVADGAASMGPSAPLFTSGDAAFYMNTSSALASIDGAIESSDGDVELVAMGLPHIDGVESAGPIPGGGALWIFDRDDDRRAIASWLLVEYLSGLPQLSAYHEATGYVPGRSDAPDDETFRQFWSMEPVFRAGYDELVEASQQALPNERDGRAGPFHEIDVATGLRLAQAQSGELSVDAAFDALVDDVNALLDQYTETVP